MTTFTDRFRELLTAPKENLHLFLEAASNRFIHFLLSIRYRKVTQALSPLANHLEHEIFPILLRERVNYLSLSVSSRNGNPIGFIGNAAGGEFRFPGTEKAAGLIHRRSLSRILLDTQLTAEQIIETLLLYLHLETILSTCDFPARNRASDNRHQMATEMLSPEGHRRFCAAMHYDPLEKCLRVDYAYCELLLSKAVRGFTTDWSRFGDHRALFQAAPPAALATLLLYCLPLFMHRLEIPAEESLWFLLCLLSAAWAWLFFHTIGALQYDKEHGALLVGEQIRKVTLLSRLPEANPNPIIKLDGDGKILYSNPAVHELLSRTGRPGEAAESILPEGYRELVRMAMVKGGPVEVSAERNGITLHFLFAPFPDQASVIAFGNDITELTRTEKALKRLNRDLEGKVARRTEQLHQTQDITILGFAGLAEIRDPDTGEHLARTRSYVQALAEALKDHPRFVHLLDDKMIENLYKSAPLHDIGKVGTPDAILLKEGPLTPEEYEEMKRHTVYGGDALEEAEARLGFDSFLRIACEIANYHHERWDGSGYPVGLEGEEIPLSARLMALADVYDALTSKRSYKKALSHEETRAMIVAGSGRHFDPAVVDAFLTVEGRFIDIAQEFSSSRR